MKPANAGATGATVIGQVIYTTFVYSVDIDFQNLFIELRTIEVFWPLFRHFLIVRIFHAPPKTGHRAAKVCSFDP